VSHVKRKRMHFNGPIKEIAELVKQNYGGSAVEPFFFHGNTLDTQLNVNNIYVGYFTYTRLGLLISDIDGAPFTQAPESQFIQVVGSASCDNGKFTFVGYKVYAPRPRSGAAIDLGDEA
jgi:hypothetical protein